MLRAKPKPKLPPSFRPSPIPKDGFGAWLDLGLSLFFRRYKSGANWVVFYGFLMGTGAVSRVCSKGNAGIYWAVFGALNSIYSVKGNPLVIG
jgi:hypothetical protein